MNRRARTKAFRLVSYMPACLAIAVAGFAALWISQGSAAKAVVEAAPSQQNAGSGDLLIKERIGGEGQGREITMLVKGSRQRYEMDIGMGKLASVTQCDLKRSLMINDTAKKYMIRPISESDEGFELPSVADLGGAQSQPAKRGGVINQTVTMTDTGERKKMFGLTARHIKTSAVSEPSADACDTTRSRIDTDGWYVDLNVSFGCGQNNYRPPRMTRNTSGCHDQIRVKEIGGGRPGFPLSLTTTTYKADGSVESTSTIEVTELSTAALDPALFDVPAGYSQTATAQELFGMPSMNSAAAAAASGAGMENAGAAQQSGAKGPGAVRIGVVSFNDKSGRSLSLSSLRDELIGSINEAGIEAVPLSASTPEQAEAEASARQCDFILYTDIESLKTASASRKVGGLLGRAAGVGSMGTGKSEAKLDFRLNHVGNSTPAFSSSSSAKEEGDEATISAALRAEARAVASEARKKR